MNERNQRALEDAKKQGYFIKGLFISMQTYRTWKQWCIGQGIPEIAIKPWQGKKQVFFDGDTFHSFYAQHPVDYLPWMPTLTPTPVLKERLSALAKRYPYQQYNFSEGHIHVYGVSAEHAILIAQEIVAIWNEAKQHPDNLAERYLMVSDDI